MPSTTKVQDDYAALNKLIVDCPDFSRLEALLGGFNIFQVLKFEHGEIRHSNVLAWILDPAGSHGLDSTFLQKWLMRVIHESEAGSASPVTPVDIDAWQLLDVEVRREWQHIDLLLILNFVGGFQWTICIENKINSAQHSDQLRRYRTIVESEFTSAKRRIYIFLTKSEEEPDDKSYLTASYAQVHRVLKECLEARSHAIGIEPNVLLEKYLRLLEEKFMDESEIARTALKIYQQHRRALDVIFEHRPDYLRGVSERIQKLFTERAEQLGVVMTTSTKNYLRFVPKAWDQPGNTHGKAWPNSTRTVVFELNLKETKSYLWVMSGGAPDAWIDPVWQRTRQVPFNPPKRSKSRPPWWCMLHVADSCNTALDDEDVSDPGELAQRIYDWCVKSLGDSRTKEVIDIIAAELPKLEAIHAAGV